MIWNIFSFSFERRISRCSRIEVKEAVIVFESVIPIRSPSNPNGTTPPIETIVSAGYGNAMGSIGSRRVIWIFHIRSKNSPASQGGRPRNHSRFGNWREENHPGEIDRPLNAASSPTRMPACFRPRSDAP